MKSYKSKNHILNCSFNKLFKNKMNSDKDKIINYNSHCLKIFDDDNIQKKFNN